MNDCQHERAYDNGPGFIKTCKDCLKFQLPGETRWQTKIDWERAHEIGIEDTSSEAKNSA